MGLTEGVSYLLAKLSGTFLSLDSAFSLTSLFCALCIAAGFLIIKRRQKNRRVRARTIVRALFPHRIAVSPSHAADVGYFFFNIFVFGIVFGWALLSYQVLSNFVIDRLVSAFGAAQPTALPDVVARAAITAALFLAYELGYWIDHYLSHRVPFLWEFHKVHHTASVLTPLTLFRVHPVDSVIHGNILAVVMGVTNGAMNYLFGKTTYQYAITDTNAILVLFVHAYVHLQHTHLWIPFRGVLGRILLSPAHHQVHNSSNPVHFNKNLGSCLAVWDWLFGTLHIPAREPEKLHFGVAPADQAHADPHTIAGALLEPLYRALSRLTSNSSTSVRVGARAIPPKRVHLTAAAAVANDSASHSSRPSASASANAP